MAEFVRVTTRAELPPGGKALAEVDGRAIPILPTRSDWSSARQIA